MDGARAKLLPSSLIFFILKVSYSMLMEHSLGDGVGGKRNVCVMDLISSTLNI